LTTAESTNEGKVLLLSFVIPGNSYPVTQTDVLNGKSCLSGYQSHYTLCIFYFYYFFFFHLTNFQISNK